MPDFELQLKTSLSSIKKMVDMNIKELEKGIQKGLTQGMAMLEKKAKGIFGRPGALKVKTGNLKRSIKSSRAKKKAGEIFATIGSNVEYAPVHEFGAVIRAKDKPYLVFKGSDGKLRFVKKVIIPKRPFISLAYTSSRALLRKMIDDAVIKEIRK